MNKFLKAELWEIQTILYLILAFLLLRFASNEFTHILGIGVLCWAAVAFYGTIRLLQEAREEAEV